MINKQAQNSTKRGELIFQLSLAFLCEFSQNYFDSISVTYLCIARIARKMTITIHFNWGKKCYLSEIFFIPK